jgi:hypothetical protein
MLQLTADLFRAPHATLVVSSFLSHSNKAGAITIEFLGSVSPRSVRVTRPARLVIHCLKCQFSLTLLSQRRGNQQTVNHFWCLN